MKKLIIVLLVAFAGVASAAVPPEQQACFDLANKDKSFGDALLKVVDARLDAEVLKVHTDAFQHVQKNEAHVIYAYAALWVIAAGFLVFLWRRQQVLRSEIAQLRGDLAAAAKEGA